MYAVVDKDGDGKAEQVHVLAQGLDMPSGVAFKDGTLYVAEISRVLRLRDVARDLAKPPKPEVVSSAFPTDKHHGWKFIAFGPDGRLYVPVGAPCNVCLPPGPLHATITRHGRGRRAAGGGGATVCATASASTSPPTPRSSGSPRTGATGSATTSRPTSSTA